MWSVVAVVTAAALAATYLTWLAGRVDRLHARASAATRALDAHLVRRSAAVAVLAEARATPELYAAARAALDAEPGDREAAENDLTRELAGLAGRGADPAVEPVVAASRRVAVARQVHTDLVRDALAVRRHPLVRLLRLTRRHPRPEYFDIGDPTIDTGGPVVPRAAGPVALEGAVPGVTGQATQV